MSDTQTVWMILWKRATQSPHPRDPFEIAEVVPEVCKTLNVNDRDAAGLVGGLLKELERLPEGKRYFTREGDAILPLPEFAALPKDPESEFAAYPYEL
jgi:hypothetical protein